ncbi:MAG TPA: hydroxymethylbilane synthase [Bacteroidota bacterium]|nr:hydroxymethylbilane synthase [Bacteroidota bacterium]
MTTKDRIIIGTRGSELALWQASWVRSELQKLYPSLSVETAIIKTTGDKILDSSLSTIGDKGLFTKEIENALLDHAIDLAVHSLKDVPTNLADGLTIAAVTEREDVRDVFVSHPRKKYASFGAVPQGGTIATGSLRRRCQLLSHRPDLSIVDIRGNLKTRRTKLENSNWDGMLLAKAGVTRLGWSGIISEVLSPTFILPAVGQGALAIETRQGDEFLLSTVARLEHVPTRQATDGERALLRFLEGGCQIPIGTYGRVDSEKFFLDAMVGSIDGTKTIYGAIEGAAADSGKLGTVLAQELLGKGAKEILQDIRTSKH